MTKRVERNKLDEESGTQKVLSAVFGYLYRSPCFQYTLERYCVCVHLFFIMMSFPSLFYLYDTVAMGLCDVKCKFLPRSSVFQEGTGN